jgi:ribulose 1,5-bisphosphate carboxylase large subunit-like protein
MTCEDIIRMAEECGIPEFENNESQADNILRFAALVAAAERTRTWTQAHWTDYERSIAAAEREECAKVCETYDHADPLGVSTECAAAIRKRGNA